MELQTLLSKCKQALQHAKTMDDVEYIEGEINKHLNRRLKAHRELDRKLEKLIHETINQNNILPFI